MGMTTSLSIILLSLSAIPITYVVNSAHNLHGEVGLLASGVVCLSVLCFLVYLVISREGSPRDPLFYVFMLGTFSSVADLIIGLETDKLLTGFMTNYLKDGEPYLQTPYGAAICYWDGLGHYLMYIIMLVASARGRSYREVGLYWAGSIGHSMIVFIPGNVVGKFGLRPSFLLNVPYMFIPFWGMARFLRERPKESLSVQQANKAHKSLLSRPLDLLLVVGLEVAMAVAFLRGFASLNAPNSIFQTYLKDFEPYLMDPVAYPKMQMLVYLFQYVPFYVLSIYALIYPGQSWMPDWALIHAGAAAQAQVSHIGGSLHYRTDPQYHVPATNPNARLAFWLINAGLLLVLPQILALRCNVAKGHFTPATVAKAEGKAVTAGKAAGSGKTAGKAGGKGGKAKKAD